MGKKRKEIKLSFFKRKFVCTILLFVLLSVIASVQATATTTTTITIPATTASQNSFATLPITVTDVGNYGTGTINIEYNPAVVHVTNVSDAPAGTSTVTAWTADNIAGIARISAWNIAGVSGDVIFANVEFLAVGTAGTSTSLKLTVSSLQDTSYKDIPATVIHGAFNIEVEEDNGTSNGNGNGNGNSNSGSGDSDSDGGRPDIESVTTPTPTLTPTAIPTPTTTTRSKTGNVAQNETPTPVVSPVSTEIEEATPSVPVSVPQGKGKTPGFETIFACSALLIVHHILSLRRQGGKGK